MKPEPTATSELVVPISRARLTRMAIGTGVQVVMGVCMLVLASHPEVGGLQVPEAIRLIVGAVGLLGVAFFGACGAWALFRIAKPAPAVILDHNGILDNASFIGIGFIAWDQIAELREYHFMRQRILGIVPMDMESRLAGLPVWKRLAIRLNRLFGCPPVNISEAMLPMSVPQLMREIDARRRVRIGA